MADIRLGHVYVTKRQFWKSYVVVLEADNYFVRALPHGLYSSESEFSLSRKDFLKKYEHDPNCLYCKPLSEQEEFVKGNF